MNSFLTVNNNLSLISISIAPSTYLASFTLLLFFLAFYIPRIPSRLPRLPSFSFLRGALPSFDQPSTSTTFHQVGKRLPEVPIFADNHQLVLQDQSLILSSRDLASLRHRSEPRRQSRRSAQNHPRHAREELLSAPPLPVPPRSAQQRSIPSHHHGRSARWPRRLSTGLRTSSEPTHLNTSPLDSSSQRGSNDRPIRRPRGVGNRFRRWLLTTGVAETGQRREEQRVLEEPKRS